MKNALFAIIALAVVAWSAGLLSPASGTSGDVPFINGFDAGLESARAENRPYMLYFTADW